MKLPPASYSFLTDFRNCPRKAWHKFVARDLPRESRPAMDYGIAVHKAFEERLRANKPFPDDMKEFEAYALAAEQGKGKMYAEEQLSIAGDGTPTDFFGEKVWLRGKIDFARINENVAVMLDWKTGKPNEDPFELEIGALMLKCTYRGLEIVRGAYVWLKEKRIGRMFDLSNFARTFNEVKTTMKAVEALPLEQEWPPTSNPLCGWCPVKSCPHNTNRE
jgi:CRISPR/Cas system-associated exonuclease Cas4 (RecB family)